MSRGPTKAVKKAAAHVGKHPNITAAEVAKKFGLDVSTVYRAEWWKNRTAAQKKSAE